jgi:hypothetical protein
LLVVAVITPVSAGQAVLRRRYVQAALAACAAMAVRQNSAVWAAFSLGVRPSHDPLIGWLSMLPLLGLASAWYGSCCTAVPRTDGKRRTATALCAQHNRLPLLAEPTSSNTDLQRAGSSRPMLPSGHKNRRRPCVCLSLAFNGTPCAIIAAGGSAAGDRAGQLPRRRWRPAAT